MTRLKTIVAMLIAILCIGGALTAGASAATKKGEINGTKGTAPTKATFTGSAGKGTLKTALGSLIECEKTAITEGKITSHTAGSANFVFTECSSGGSKCKTEGAANAGEIVVAVTLLGATSANGQNDLILNSVTETIINCGGLKEKVRGSLFVKVLTENVLGTAQQFEAASTVAGVQEPEETTNHLQAEFVGKGWSNASINSGVISVTFSESVDFV